MFEHWGEFYLMAGSAAAVLIGLIFIAVTLIQDRPRSSVLMGSKLYMGPVVLHVTFVLVLSAVALTPEIGAGYVALIAGAIALWGFARGILSISGINGLKGEDQPHWTDQWFYGIIPAIIYVLLAVVAFGFRSGAEWAQHALAGVIVALLALTIRNEWDLVTWLAPKADGKDLLE